MARAGSQGPRALLFDTMGLRVSGSDAEDQQELGKQGGGGAEGGEGGEQEGEGKDGKQVSWGGGGQGVLAGACVRGCGGVGETRNPRPEQQQLLA